MANNSNCSTRCINNHSFELTFEGVCSDFRPPTNIPEVVYNKTKILTIRIGCDTEPDGTSGAVTRHDKLLDWLPFFKNLREYNLIINSDCFAGKLLSDPILPTDDVMRRGLKKSFEEGTYDFTTFGLEAPPKRPLEAANYVRNCQALLRSIRRNVNRIAKSLQVYRISIIDITRAGQTEYTFNKVDGVWVQQNADEGGGPMEDLQAGRRA
ncbi:hypothetical protein EJ08DRAFT_462400 [Tothia fuscella]|uniref:Uncharacterized protein n=1 Tax=Tothia fuscella TaxID=1048955 RepID=A0A9P4NIH8_9PEZI|nr:hypothetical protein EJ08DRAFT_462400 [Tothia fuscella]